MYCNEPGLRNEKRWRGLMQAKHDLASGPSVQNRKKLRGKTFTFEVLQTQHRSMDAALRDSLSAIYHMSMSNFEMPT